MKGYKIWKQMWWDKERKKQDTIMQVNMVQENNIPHAEFYKFIITSHVSPTLHLPLCCRN